MTRQAIHLLIDSAPPSTGYMMIDPTSTTVSSSTSTPDRSISDDDELTGFRNMTVSPIEKLSSPRKSQQVLPPVNRLPPELLIAIFSKITSLIDLRACMLVSRQWANCSVELLWHRPHFSDFKKYEAMVAAIQDQNAFYPYPQLIKRLNLTPIAMEANDGSMKPLGLCTKLERLTLTGCMNLTDSPLMEILASNPRIQALDMSQLQNITDISINVVVQHCPRLQGLNVAGCRRITDASMVPLSQHCKLLRRVNFLRLPFFSHTFGY